MFCEDGKTEIVVLHENKSTLSQYAFKNKTCIREN